MIGRREGKLRNLLAEGVKRASEKMGGNPETGIATREKLIDLGIREIADQKMWT
jgi:aldehyde:ferredoxin oxidoreductase